MTKRFSKKGLLSTASVLAIGAFGFTMSSPEALAAVRTESADNATGVAIASNGDTGNITIVVGAADADGFTIADARNVGAAGLAFANASGTTGQGTLNYAGDSTTTGTVGASGASIGRALLGVNGKTVAFTGGDVYIDSIVYSADGAVTMADDFTGSVDFANADGTFTMAGATFTGNADSTGAGADGLLVFSGSTAFTGTVGATNALTKVDVGANGSTSSFSSTIAATNVNITGTGSASFAGNITGALVFAAGANTTGTATLGAGVDISGAITAATANEGVLTFTSGTQTVTSIGATGGGNELSKINTGTAAISGTGAIAATSIIYTGDGSITMANSQTIEGAITTSTTNTGTLTMKQAGTITGSVGTSTVLLKQVTLGSTTAGVVAIDGDLYATNVNFATDGTLNVAAGHTIGTTAGTVTATTHENGTIHMDAAGTINAQLGTSSTASLKKVIVGNGAVSVNDHIYTKELNFDDDNATTVADNVNLTIGSSGITADANSEGTLTFSGTSTVTGAVGTDGGNKLKVLNVGADSEAVTFSSTVDVTTTNITGTGSASFAGNIDGALVFGAGAGTTGLATFGAGVDITGNITAATAGEGVLTFTSGAQTAAEIGVKDGGNELATINTGTAAIAATGDYAATNIIFTGDGSITVANNKELEGAITTSTNNTGTIVVSNNGTIDGQVGTSSAKLKLITVAGTTTGATAVTGDINATTVNFGTNGSMTVATGKAINAAVTATTADNGQVHFDGTGTIGGQFGTSAKNLVKVVVGNGAVTQNYDVYTKELNFDADNILTVTDGKNITVGTTGITTDGNDTGTLTLSGSHTITGTVAATGTSLGLINIDSSSSSDTVTFTGNVFTDTWDATASSATVSIAGGTTLDIDDGITAAQSGTGTYKLNINSTTGSAAKILGNAGNLDFTGATVKIAVTGNTILTSGTTYDKVLNTAGTITNITAGTALDDSYLYDFEWVADGADFDLKVSSATTLASATQAAGGAGTAAQAISATATGNLSTAIASALSSPDQASARKAVESLAPALTGAPAATITTQNASLSTVETRLASLRDGARGIATGGAFQNQAVWGQIFGDIAEQDAREGASGYETQTAGMAFGIDGQISDKDRLGIAFSMANSEVDSDINAATQTDIESYQVNVYGSRDEGKWYLDGLVGFGYNQFDSQRGITGLTAVAVADYSGWQATAKVGGGYKLPSYHGLHLTPVASLQYTYSDFDSYTETGAGNANATVSQDNINTLESTLGAKLAYPVESGGVTIIPELRAAWVYDITGDEAEATSSWQGGGASFKTSEAEIARNKFRGGAGLTIATKGNATVSADYTIQAKDEYVAHSGLLKVKFAF